MISKWTLLEFRVRRLCVILSCPGVSVCPNVRLSRSVRLQATDGGEIILNNGCQVSDGVSIVAQGGRVELGENTFIGPWSTIVGITGISIGSDSLIAERVTIRDQDHHIRGESAVPINQSGFNSAQIVIGNNVWKCAGAVILKGVSIGTGAVVAANAVVVCSVGDLDIVGGIPANSIGNRKTLASAYRFKNGTNESF